LCRFNSRDHHFSSPLSVIPATNMMAKLSLSIKTSANKKY
jgi:hypothetical protein